MLPIFVKLSTSTFTIGPTTQVGSYVIEVLLSDGSSSAGYTFRIIVVPLSNPIITSIINSLSNPGPPVFTSSLEIISILADSTLEYKLPTIADPKNDSYAIGVNL